MERHRASYRESRYYGMQYGFTKGDVWEAFLGYAVSMILGIGLWPIILLPGLGFLQGKGRQQTIKTRETARLEAETEARKLVEEIMRDEGWNPNVPSITRMGLTKA